MKIENKSLVSIVMEAAVIEQMLIESGGELTPEIEQMLEIRDTLVGDKVDSYKMVMDRFSALADFYEEKAKAFKQIANNCNMVTDKLKANIKFVMEQIGTDEVSGNDFRFKLQKSPTRLVVDSEYELPEECKKTIIMTNIDKEKLKEDLKMFKVQGAHLEVGESLRSYVAKKK